MRWYDPKMSRKGHFNHALLLLWVTGYLRDLFCFVLFFCCKANLSIIGNAKQVEFTVLLINYFLIQLWLIDFQTCMRHHFASKLSCGEEECIWKGVFSPAPRERWWLSPFCVLLHIKFLSLYAKMQVLCVICLETYRTSWEQYK